MRARPRLAAAIRDCGITERGEKLAAAVWAAAPAIFEAGEDDPFETAEVAARLLRDWAAQERRSR